MNVVSGSTNYKIGILAQTLYETDIYTLNAIIYLFHYFLLFSLFNSSLFL